ncbi:MAG: serine hydrolase domain-containing protein [Bacteroidota bacterium]
MHFLYSLFFLLLLTGFYLPAQPSSATIAQLDSLFAEFDRTDAPGVAISIRHRGKTVYERAFGMADLARGIDLTHQTPFAAGELAGQFTALALLQLAAAGKLSLNDPIQDHLPELIRVGENTTLRHLLSRTHGLHDIASLRRIRGAGANEPVTLAEVLGVYARQPAPGNPPGTVFGLSDAGLWLVAEIVSRVADQPFPEYCQEKIFTPLGMPNTYFVTAGTAQPKGAAVAYRREEDGAFTRQPVLHHAPGPGGLYTSVADWSRWEAHRENPPANFARIINQLTTSATLDDGHEHYQTMGKLTLGQDFLHWERGLDSYYRIGGGDGYTSAFFRFPEQAYSVVVLGNNGMPYTGYLGMNATHQLLAGQFPEPAVVQLTTADLHPILSATMESFTGSYWDAYGTLVRTITYENDTLFYNRPGRRIPLYPIGPRRFQLLTGYDDQIFLEFSEGASPQRMTYADRQSDPFVFQRFTPIAPAAVEGAAYAGTYYSDELGIGFTVTWQDNSLLLQASPDRQITLRPRIADAFTGDLWYWGNVVFTRTNNVISGFHFDVVDARHIWFRRLPAG